MNSFVPMGGLKVAIELPEELQSADRLTFDSLTVLLSSPTIDFQSLLSFSSSMEDYPAVLGGG
ncbi:MAG: hypothetical protein M3Z96_07800 [Pseudomonadota bacterium]|nr:hypothetical protein [Pseudomonadota bacterium]